MQVRLPFLNLKAKLIALMVVLLALTLGAELIVSLRAQDAIVRTTQRKVRDLASVIQISVQELTSIAPIDRDRLQNHVTKLHTSGLEVSIASSQNLIINSSNPKLIGAALDPAIVRELMTMPSSTSEPVGVPASKLGLPNSSSTVYFIPVEVEDHLLGYVEVSANFSDFDRPLRDYRIRLLSLALAIFALGLVFAYVLAERYVEPIHAVADAAQNIAARGLEPVPEARRRDEIGLLTRSFNEMVSQLRHARERELELNRLERFTALGQLAGALAHEVKNPLNFISLALDQLRTRYGPQLTRGREDFVRQLGIMKDEVRRLSDMVQTFLHYGQPIEIHPAPTDVRQLVEGVLALSESKLKSQGIEVAEQGVEIPGEAQRRCRKGAYLLRQRRRQCDPGDARGGHLNVAFVPQRRPFHRTLSDTGTGIDPELVEHIFEPFFTTKREGIGLGLFFSKAIVEKHGGTIAIGPNAAAARNYRHFHLSARRDTKEGMNQASVLVVEDNDLERQITADTLRDEGFAVEAAALGKRAMEMLQLSRFDVVLTDLMMPGMSGEEILAKVKLQYPATQVVVLTAHGTIDSAVQAMKNGAFYYLTKPTDREALVMTVGKAAELANLQEENQLLRTQMEGKPQVEGIIGQDPAIRKSLI